MELLSYNLTLISEFTFSAIVIMGLSVLHPGVEVTSVIGDPQKLIDEDVHVTSTDHSVVKKKPRKCFFTSSSESDNSEICKPKAAFDKIIYPIKELQAYQKKGTIRAIIVSKTSIRSFSGQRGMIKVFDMHLMDDTGEIIAKCSGQAVDKFYKMIQVNCFATYVIYVT